MIISAGNGVSVHSALPSLYSQTAQSVSSAEKKETERNFDQVTISAREATEKSPKMDIKSKVYNDMRTATTTGKVAAIRSQIEAGEYKIDSTEIARRMLLLGEA